MTGKSFFKMILLLILTTISYFYVYVTYLNIPNIILNYEGTLHFSDFLELLSILLPLTISLTIILLYQKKKKLALLLAIFDLTFMIRMLYLIIREFVLFQSFNNGWLEEFYLITISITFTYSILNRKKQMTIYDNFTLILSIIGILVFYRYYLDPHFLHNIFHNNYTNSGVITHQIYIQQYYPIFILGYVVLLIGNKIESLK